MDESRLRYFYTGVVLFIAASGFMDLYDDGLGDRWGMHQTIEVVLLSIALGSVVWIWILFARQMRRAKEHLAQMSGELKKFRERNSQALGAMKSAVHDQFRIWNFSPTESRVAEMIMRGYSMHQIAAILGKSERTVRHQAVSVYQKSAMTGRSDLTAFFLHDILGDED